jgi:hypothetical protein
VVLPAETQVSNRQGCLGTAAGARNNVDGDLLLEKKKREPVQMQFVKVSHKLANARAYMLVVNLEGAL